MATWFITGTNTNVGKTIFSALFAHYLTQQNVSVITQKWVQTGTNDLPIDIDIHDQFLPSSSPHSKPIQKARMPYTFKFPASAHLAAKQEKKIINKTKIIQSLRYLENHFKAVLIEGSGGIYVPLTESYTTLDLLTQLKTHTIIVIPNELGAINHALLTIEAIASRQIPISGFIINNMNPKTDLLIKNDNPLIIQKLSGISCIGSISTSQKLTLSQAFIQQELSPLTLP